MALNPAAHALAVRSAGMQRAYQHLIPKAKQAAKPSAPAPPKPKHISQTAAQVANQQVTAALAPQVSAVNQNAQAQQNAIQGFAQALLGKLQGGAGQVGQNYDAAIGQVQNLAGAASDALRNANPNQNDQQLLAALNAPQQQQQQVASNLANTFGGGAAVTLTNQGLVPVTQLATNKAAAQSFQSALPGIAANQSLLDMRGAQYDQTQNLAKVQAQRPALFQTALQNIRTNQQSRAAAAWDQQKFWQARADALKQSGDKLAAAKAQHKADLAYKYASLQSQNQRTIVQQKGQDARTAAQIDAANARAASANAIKWYQAQTQRWKSQHPTASVKQASAASRARWVKMAEDFYHGVAAKQRKTADGTGYEDVPGTGADPVLYPQALATLVAAGATRAVAMQILNTLYQPGEGGRPYPKGIKPPGHFKPKPTGPLPTGLNP